MGELNLGSDHYNATTDDNHDDAKDSKLMAYMIYLLPQKVVAKKHDP